MAKVSAAGTRIYFDKYALSSYLSNAELDVKQESIKINTFADAGPRKVVGNYDHMHKYSGFFDGASGAFDDLAFNALNTDADHYVAECFGSDAEGKVVFESIVELSDQPRKAQVGGAVLIDLAATGRGQAQRGIVLRNATITGAGSGTGQDNGAAIASGHIFAAVFRLIAFTGTDITLAVDHSPDDTTWTSNLLTSGSLVATNVVRTTVTTAVDRYLRVTASTTGGFTSAAIFVTAGQVLGS